MPPSMRAKASSILLNSLRSRSRMRSKKARSDSSEARSEGSAQASGALVLRVPSARSASSRISVLRSSSKRRKKFRSLCLMLRGVKNIQILLAPYCHVNRARNKLVCGLSLLHVCHMKSAFFDAFSGLSGDMIAGAMLDAGTALDELRAALASLPLDGYRVATRRKVVSGIAALKFDVEVSAPQPERHLGDIREIVSRGAALSAAVKKRAMAIFGALAEAEAKIHHTTPEAVHF